MTRQLRIEFAGGLYHVTSRGDRREPIFLQDADRLAWLTLLGDVCKRFNWVCHAYCLMTNHYHLVLETAEGNLSQGMRQLNGVYTQYINRIYYRVGHVFQGRYKAVLVEKDSHLLELARYVVLNPVRANLVSHPGEWPWSSYLAMIAMDTPPMWLQTDWLLAQFGTDRPRSIRSYSEFVQAGRAQPSIWLGLRQQIFLGSETFIKEAQQKIKVSENLTEIPKLQHRPTAKPLDDYAKLYPDRNLAMLMAFQTGDYTLKAIADYFKVHYSTVSRIVNNKIN